MRWLTRAMRRFKYLYVTRTIGLVALGYEVLVEKVDKPSVMIVVGAMILGTEALSLGRRKSDDR